MPDKPPAIPPPKSELPTTDRVRIMRCNPGGLDTLQAHVFIREDGFVTIEADDRTALARSYLALCAAARACGQALARAEMREAFEEASLVTDPVIRRIDEIQHATADTLTPEAGKLMELAKEAQRTGEMPDLSRLNPHESKCRQ
jgi:hypothetical protein